MGQAIHQQNEIHFFDQDRNYWGSIAGILLVTFVVFYPSLSCGFTNWDDEAYVVENATIRQFDIGEIFSAFTAALYTPLTILSYSLDYFLGGLKPIYYHLDSLLWHLLNVVLVIVFLTKFSKDRFIALVVGLLFAIHPTHVEPVVWVSSRKDLLATFFSLLSLLAYWEYKAGNGHTRYMWLGAWCCMVLACLSKPTAFGLPVVFVVLDYQIERRWTFSMFWKKWPFLLVSFATVAMGGYVVRSLGIKIAFEEGYGVWEVVCMACYGIVFYFYRAAVPIRLSNYHVYPFPHSDMPVEYTLAPFLFVLLAFLFWKFRAKLPEWQIALLLFFSLLLPTYRFYPAGYPLVAERYFYLSSVGLFYLLANFFKAFLAKKTRSTHFVSLLFGILFLAICGVSSAARTTVWKNSQTLWTSTIKTYPNLYYAYASRGRYYLKIGNREKALADLGKAVELQNEDADLLNTYGNILYEEGDTSSALRLLNRCLSFDTTKSIYFYNRANILKAMGKFEPSIQDYDKCLQKDSMLAEAYNNRGVAKIFIADTLGAYKDFTQAVKLNLFNAMFLDNLRRAEQLVKTKRNGTN